MATQDFKRKLTAILSADVKGYSRLMREDEEATVRTITAYRTAIANLIQQYRGRVVDSPGDNILAEFTSVVDAVNCAVEIQRELAERNADLPAERKMQFRIGINLGDVIQEGERIYGDGVNIAARMEGLAEGGGICISGTVYDAIEAKLGLEYEYLGEQEVKNIDKPVRAYRVLSFPGAAAHRVIRAKKHVRRKWLGFLTTVAVLVLGAAVFIWNFYLRLPTVEIVSERKTEFSLPTGPSVAVLPFVNMSGDPEQEYFIDGLTENVITGLSGCPKLFVISRSSTFTYKNKLVNVQQVARELGVQYVVEGSVQKAKDRVRITVQLINATTGHHLWAEKYDRELGDIFALQDEITIRIMSALEVRLTEGEQARLRYRGPVNLEVFVKKAKALAHFRQFNREGNALAKKEVEEALAVAPENSSLYSLLAATHMMDLWLGSTESNLISFAQATTCVKKAIALDKDNSDAYLILGKLHEIKREHDEAIAAAERAVVLNPNGADAYAGLGNILTLAGRPEKGVEFVKKAIRLSPIPPAYYFSHLGLAYRDSGQYEEAILAYKKAIYKQPTLLFAHLGLAASYIYVGQEEEAHAEAAEVLKVDPEFSLERYARTLPYKNKADTDRYVDALRKAGLK
ncbi:MAG: tetratricopeptide repeat protein [Deltaproteobacteria bacterium]|nr:tetratricopeptide repeat protein [Deltaproteobacteria bacterium]